MQNFTIVNIPLILGAYPVTPVGSALKSVKRLSVAKTPIAATVIRADAPDKMALVPKAVDPDAITCRTILQFKTTAPGVMLDPVLLMTMKFTLPAVQYFMIVSAPLALGAYPVVLVGSALKSAKILSVDKAASAGTVTVAAAVPDGIALVPKVAVPAAATCRMTFQFKVIAAPGVMLLAVLLITTKFTWSAVQNFTIISMPLALGA